MSAQKRLLHTGRIKAGLCLLLALSALPASRAGGLGQALPGELDVAALVALERIIQDFPGLTQQGMLAEKLDELKERGFPDPRSQLETVAMGARLGGPKGIREGMTLAVSRTPIVPMIQALAETKGVALKQRAERGVHFFTGEFQGHSSEFADLADGKVYGAYDPDGKHALSGELLKTLAGAAKSFKDRYSRDLDEKTYLTLRAELEKKIRKELGDTKLAHLAHLTGASAELTRTGDQMNLDVQASLTGSIKAMGASAVLGSKLSKLTESVSDPAAKRFLQAAKLERDGKTLKITATCSAEDFEQGLLALMSLGEAKAKAKMAEKGMQVD